MRPMLFVGLGDSGSQTLEALKLTLDRRLKQINWSEGPPAAWRFVHVDLVRREESPSATTTSYADFISLLQPGETYNDAYAVIDGLFDSEETKTRALAGWMRPPLPVRELIQQTQLRALGRSAIGSRLGELRHQLIPHIAALRDGGNVAQLQSLAHRLGIGNSTYAESPNPVVAYFGSLPGSTGSAILLDVAAVMTSIDPNAKWLHEQVAFLYTPEIFESLPEGMRSQIPMNTLGAIAEISSGLWANEMSPATQALFNASGIQVRHPETKPAFGLAEVYLVGASKGMHVDNTYGESTPSINDVFSSFGESMAGLLTHPEMDFPGAFHGNEPRANNLSKGLPDGPEPHRQGDAIEELPFSAVEVARISTGMEHLLNYVSEGLARNQIELLLFPRFEPAVQCGFESEQDRIARAVEEHDDSFTAHCELLNASSHLHAGRLASLDREASGPQAPEFIPELQRYLVDYTAMWVSRVGLQVTADLLRVLRSQVEEFARHETQESATRHRPHSPHNSLTTETEMILHSLVEVCEFSAIRLGAELDASFSGASARVFAELPDLSADRFAASVSSRSRPRQFETTLIAPESFPYEFEHLMIRDLPDNKKTQWESLTRSLSLQRLPLRSMDPHNTVEVTQSLIEFSAPEIPDGDEGRDNEALRLRMPTTIQEIVLRNRAWLQDRQSSFGTRCLMGLAEYCTGEDDEMRVERQKQFLKSFADMILGNAPSIDSKPGAFRSVHGSPTASSRPNGVNLTLSAIPFARHSAIGRGCAEILAQAGVDADALTFESSSMRADVVAVFTRNTGLSAPIFTSLVNTFLQVWLLASTHPSRRSTFWNGRRSRPLSESVPIRPEVRLSMIIGWFVSFMFGQRKTRNGNSMYGHKWEIWDPQAQWVDFPYPRLRDTANGDSDLPAILESISLAMVQSASEASEGPLAPYVRLDQVGREITTARHLAGRGFTTSDLIRTWVATGTVPAGAPSHFPLVADNSGRTLATPQERRLAITLRVETLRDEYKALWANLGGTPWHELPGMFELKEDVAMAMDLLLHYCENLSFPDSPSPASE